MSDRWVVMTELEFWGGDPAYDKTVPTWVVSDNGEDDPPLCYCDGEPEAHTIANALNAVQAVRDLASDEGRWMYGKPMVENHFGPDFLDGYGYAMSDVLAALDGERDE